jgi:predicted 2-oxoglutarate/Fe(II)-dependent dioxygenase YbiX
MSPIEIYLRNYLVDKINQLEPLHFSTAMAKVCLELAREAYEAGHSYGINTGSGYDAVQDQSTFNQWIKEVIAFVDHHEKTTNVR